MRYEIKKLETCKGCSNFIDTGCGTKYCSSLKKDTKGIIPDECPLPTSIEAPV